MRRIVIGACLALLLSGPAFAASTKAGAQKCTKRLMRVEALVYGEIKAKALSEAKAEEVTKLLDEADALCTEGNYSKANATFAKVTKMVSKAADKTPAKAPK
jgi:hypothetical protein